VGLFVLMLALCQFIIHNLRLSYLWDGYQIWASKAQLLFYKGGLSRDWFLPGEYERVLEYPPLISLWEALIAYIRGEFEWNSLKVIFPYFYVSALVSVYYLTRTFASRQVSVCTAACVALIPCFATRFAIGGYADMPQACFVVGAVSAFAKLDSSAGLFRKLAPWILLGVLLIKAEGSFLTLIFAGVALVFYGFRRTVLKMLKIHYDLWAVPLAGFLMRVAYIKWLGRVDPTYGPMDREHILHAWRLGLSVPTFCAKYIVDRGEWGLLWPAFFLSACFVLLFCRRFQKAVALGCLTSVAAYTGIFYFTNWDYKWHIELAYNRLLIQIAPVALVVCVMALVGIEARLRQLIALKESARRAATKTSVRKSAQLLKG
jgi:hypothetical protein